MKKFFKEFKEFISRGNVVDLAVAVVVGGAFGKIVTSLVNNIIMPLISLATGGVSIEDWKWIIKPADSVAGTAESALNYGVFIQSIIDFLIISFFIFLAIKLIQRSKSRFEKVTNTIKNNNQEKLEVTTEDSVNETEQAATEEAPNTLVDFQSLNNQSNEKQEKLLEEIRDLLKK